MTLDLAGYDDRYGDLALPMGQRDTRRARKLFAELLAEGPRARVDYLIGFLRAHGLEEAELSPEGLRAIGLWLAQAPLEATQPDPDSFHSTILSPPWRAIAVDVMIFMGELIRLDYPEGEWVLDKADKRHDGRLLPVLNVPIRDQRARYVLSEKFYTSLAHGFARKRVGLVKFDVGESPIGRGVEGFHIDYERTLAAITDAEKDTAWGKPAVPAIPESSREVFRRAEAEGDVGSFGEFIVFAPMSQDRAQQMVDAEEFPTWDEPNPALVRFVEEVYRVWPHVTDDDEVPSPWEQDLYGDVFGEALAVDSSEYAAAGPVLGTVLTIAAKYGMPVYSAQDGKFI